MTAGRPPGWTKFTRPLKKTFMRTRTDDQCSLEVISTGYRVRFGTWTAEFETRDKALECMADFGHALQEHSHGKEYK